MIFCNFSVSRAQTENISEWRVWALPGPTLAQYENILNDIDIIIITIKVIYKVHFKAL